MLNSISYMLIVITAWGQCADLGYKSAHAKNLIVDQGPPRRTVKTGVSRRGPIPQQEILADTSTGLRVLELLDDIDKTLTRRSARLAAAEQGSGRVREAS